ncbi:ABC transporter substrate-binding protein [Consotaella aegiceratis]|uniref:ABC transporter substrate-binding protein n=1 Tax=Consotaella aegiceratis TaxID=3097961 RepID=UPI002F422389
MRGTAARWIGTALAAQLAAVAPSLAQEATSEPPRRVVSTNLCTDQLAMLVAGDGQLYSVSELADDPIYSVLADRAKDYVVNHGSAEEIFLMHPDLVLAGPFSSPASVDMLRRLGFRVEMFQPETSFGQIRANLRRMGEILGHPRRADALIAEMDAAIAALPKAASRETIALFFANDYTAGRGTLADEVVRLAGLDNLAARLGITAMARIPLEELVMARPDLIIGQPSFSTPALAYQNLRHPAIRARVVGGDVANRLEKYWTCGGPFSVEAARILVGIADRAATARTASQTQPGEGSTGPRAQFGRPREAEAPRG